MRFEVLEDRSLLSITLTGVPNWIEQGPRPIIEAQLNALPNSPAAGAIQSIAVNPNIVDPAHPNNHQIYVGAVNGGVWRTDNFDPANPTATAWRPLTDQQASLAISSVAIDPLDASGNVVFAGTGSFSNLAQQGDPPVGLLRTTDGGVSWTTHKLINSFTQPRITTVLPTSVDTDPGPGVKEVILVGAIDLRPGVPGLYRSTDNGDNFTLISGTNGLPEGAVSDIIVSPNPSNRGLRFFAAVPGRGIFRSISLGQTWTSASSGITGLSSSSNIQMAAFNNGIFTTALYAAIVDTSKRLTGVFRSTTHGDSWTRLALPTELFTAGSFGGSGFQIIADATNSQVAYLGGSGNEDGEILRYDPAGAGSWVLIVGAGAKNHTSPHADSRDFAFVGASLLNANDGGLCFINNPRDARNNSWQSLQGSGTTGIGAMEMHNISYDNRFNVLWGGAQDNGTSGQSAPNNLVWRLYAGGDGGDVAVDSVTRAPAGKTIRYVSSQGLINFSAYVFDTATNDASHVALLPAAGLEGLAPSFITPIELNALAPPSGQSKRLVVGGLAVQKDRIENVTATSPIKIVTNKDAFGHGLSTGDTVTISGVMGIPAANGTFTVTFVNQTTFSLNGTTGSGTYDATPPGSWEKNSSVLPGGAVYESRNAGIATNTADVVWTRVPTGPGFGSVNAMAAGGSFAGILNFPNVLYVGSEQRVFLRSTAGGTLSQTPAPFPGVNITDVVMDPNDWRHAFVSDSSRVYETTNAGASWNDLFSNERDIHSLEFVPAGGGVLLAGGLNGVSRLILSSPNRVWTEYGARLPNAKVYDMKYDATDDKLVATTLGRGAWTISNVSTTVATPGVLQINGDMDFAGEFDDIKLQLDPNNSTLVDVFLNTLTPLATFQLSTIEQILVNGLGGNDNLTVDFNNGNPIPRGGLAYDGGADRADQVSVVGNADYRLTNSSLRRNLGGTIDLVDVQIASLTGGADDNWFTVESWNGSLVKLAGLADSDRYFIGNGDLDLIDAAVRVTDTSGAADNATLYDAGHSKLVDYTIDGTGVSTEFTSGAARAFLGLDYNAGALEFVTLNGSAGANTFYATPHVDTTFAINGNNPTFAGPGADYLKIEFAGTRGRKLTYSGPPLGNGTWQFLGSGVPLTGARKNIDFTSIEKLNGDGILEVVTTPAGLRAPDVRNFDILSGTQIFQFQGSIPGFSPESQVAVGNVSPDGRVAVWHNDTNSISTFTPYTGVGWHAPVRVAIKHAGPLGAAEVLTAQDPGGRSREIRRFSPSGMLVDFILEDDPEFAGHLVGLIGCDWPRCLGRATVVAA
ncbi:MAG: ubiquitin-activating E1 FCCH domain-containing protein [Pirellulales bacterium]